MGRLVLAALLCVAAGCASGPANAGRADGAQDTATAAAVAAAEARARAAEGKGTRAEAAEAQARADALAAAAKAEDERQARLRAEEQAASIAADRARLGWWATAAGLGLLILAAGASALGWYFGLGKLTQGVGFACATAGGAALVLGLSWGWLPILAAVVILGGALVLLLRRAGAAIGAHAERVQAVDPGDTPQVLAVKVQGATEQVQAGVWTAVQRLRGKSADSGKLRRLLAGSAL